MVKQPRRRDSGGTRRRILDATISLLARRGTTATGLNQVVETSGVSYGSVYNQFRGGKDALVAEAVEAAGDQIGEALAAVFGNSSSLAEATATMFSYGAAQLASSDFTSGCPVGTAISDGHHVAVIRNAAVTSFDTWAEIIERGAVIHGASDADARHFASVVLSMYEGALLIARARRTTDPIDTTRDAAVALAEQVTS